MCSHLLPTILDPNSRSHSKVPLHMRTISPKMDPRRLAATTSSLVLMITLASLFSTSLSVPSPARSPSSSLSTHFLSNSVLSPRNHLRRHLGNHHHHHSSRRVHPYYQSPAMPSHRRLLSQASAAATTTTPSPEGRVNSSPSSSALSALLTLHHTIRQRHNYYHHQQQSSTTEPSQAQSSYARWHGARHLHQMQQPMPIKIIYQQEWMTSDTQLAVCVPRQACNKIDTYASPWIEKQCRCADATNPCSESLTVDNNTVVDRNRQYKFCEPVHKLPTCKPFREVTWTITTLLAKNDTDVNSFVAASIAGDSEEISRQELRCVCAANSVAYILKHGLVKMADGEFAYRYHFSCSPEAKFRCQRFEPCALFTVRKHRKVEDVNASPLCECEPGYSCPARHRHPASFALPSNPFDNTRPYSGYCYKEKSSNSFLQPELIVLKKNENELDNRVPLPAQSTAPKSSENSTHTLATWFGEKLMLNLLRR